MAESLRQEVTVCCPVCGGAATFRPKVASVGLYSTGWLAVGFSTDNLVAHQCKGEIGRVAPPR